ncbi:Glutamate racemase [Lactiplantibacillus plantarum subsp. plantarum]|uniref:Glutamate racemase n=1 Tax=Lactiplantibacillus plantarum subsp. plantarum TaxID=337330 RepID=A0A2S3U4G2_LACPN|nr:Glutamate racemase [Lactiplantibacillus plantarum subsp. plantarum]
MANEHAIGFMDSGVGGLTVVKQALKQLPRETVYFIGDQAAFAIWATTYRTGAGLFMANGGFLDG